MKKPNLFIVGNPRCGTTALYNYLKLHPEIEFPKLKEPRYLASLAQKFPHNGIGDASIDRAIIKNKEDYLALYENCDAKYIGDASPDTLFYYNTTIDEIKRFTQRPKIIIMLRNPADRAYSAYCHLVRDGREKLSFKEALAEEDFRMHNNWDFMWFFKSVGINVDAIKSFMDAFSPDCVMVITQENLERMPQETLSDIYEFLGISDYQGLDYSVRWNASGTSVNFVSRLVLSRSNIWSSKLRELLKRLVPSRLLHRLAASMIDKEVMLESDRAVLLDFYSKEIEVLENLLDRDLTEWK